MMSHGIIIQTNTLLDKRKWQNELTGQRFRDSDLLQLMYLIIPLIWNSILTEQLYMSVAGMAPERL